MKRAKAKILSDVAARLWRTAVLLINNLAVPTNHISMLLFHTASMFEVKV